MTMATLRMKPIDKFVTIFMSRVWKKLVMIRAKSVRLTNDRIERRVLTSATVGSDNPATTRHLTSTFIGQNGSQLNQFRWSTNGDDEHLDFSPSTTISVSSERELRTVQTFSHASGTNPIRQANRYEQKLARYSIGDEASWRTYIRIP